jgi:hypothetical protein
MRIVHTRVLLTVVVVGGLVLATLSTDAVAKSSEPRLTVSHRNVMPGEVVTLQSRGANTSQWVSGPATSFERRVHGDWEPMYLLTWTPSGDAPAVTPLGSGIDAVGIRDPVQAVIPAVAPGRYRLARTYGLGEEGGYKQVTLAVEVTVRPCPAGTQAEFLGGHPASATAAQDLGRPACIRGSR